MPDNQPKDIDFPQPPQLEARELVDFLRMDAEARERDYQRQIIKLKTANATMQLRLADLENKIKRLEVQEFIQSQNAEGQKLDEIEKREQPCYTSLVQGIAKRFGFDPRYITIDTATGVVRDLR